MSLASAPAPAKTKSGVWLFVVVALILAAVLAAWGILTRVHAQTSLKAQAASASIPIVTVAKPQMGPPVEEVVLPGSVKAVQETPIYARTNGYLKSWKTDIGQPVRAGQLLAVIDAPEVDQQLRQAEAEVKTAQSNAAVAQSTAKRVADLVATQSVSRQEGDDRAAAATATASVVVSNQANVERLRQPVGFERVTAPYAGVITARETDVGHLISPGGGPGSELFRIADVSRLRVYVQVPESYAAQIKPGAVADLRFSEHPGQPFPAKVSRTALALDPQSRTLLVELDIDNKAGTLFPGSYAEVHFKLPSANHTLRVSGNTLLFRSEGPRIATVDAAGRAHLHPIILGRDFGTTIEVVQGLNPTDKVIVNPPSSLDEGDKVRVVASKAPTPTAPGGPTRTPASGAPVAPVKP
jgi:RND family efflux transporter MFP subunit